jgi:outer membrane protein
MKKLSITGFCLLALSGTLAAQGKLSLSDAISIGLANNYGIIISQNLHDEAKNNATPGRAGLLPELGLNAGYTTALNNASVKVLTGNELSEPHGTSSLTTGGLGLNWRLFDGLNMFITYDKLKKLEEMSDLSAKITVENTVSRITGAYFDIIREDRIRKMLEEQVEISRFRVGIDQVRFETGTGSEIEYLKSKVEMNADVAALSNQTTQAENARSVLNDLLAREVTMAFEVDDSIPPARELVYDTLFSAMKEQNRNLQLTRKSRQISELDVRSASASLWPTLDYYAGLNYYRLQTDANFIQYNRYYGPSMGLTLSMNLFDGMNRKRDIRNAQLNLQTRDLAIRQTESGLGALLYQTWNEYRNQLELEGFEQENLRLAIRNMDLARTAYSAGSISSLQLREVQEDLLKARIRMVNVRYNIKLTETGLLLLSGKLVD